MLYTRYRILTTASNGFTLIEAMFFLFIFMIISLGFMQTYATGAHMIIESKNRLGATALANQKMEIIRSIDYSLIGTKHWNGSSWVYGVPGGDILEDETVGVNTVAYAVHTYVQYNDDPYDGTLGGSPNDTIPNDYKQVRLTVSWGQGGTDQSVATFADFSPNGIETSAGGGILSINILDSTGAGVSGATVRVKNPSSSIDFTTTTDATGNITTVGAPAGTQKYELSVSKNGYYGAVTYPPYPTTAYNPTDTHASVVNGVLNPMTVVMDHATDIHLMTKDPFGTSIPNINYHVKGGRILGVDTLTSPATTIYGLDQNGATDDSGETTLSSQSYGPYALSSISTAQYDFYKLSPEDVKNDTFSVAAGVTKDVTAILLDKSIGSVKVTVTSSVAAAPVSGATVHLTEGALGYDATATTDQYGVAYFPTALPALVDGTYTIDVSESSFTSDSSTVTISGTLVNKSVVLTPS